jgi:hypothetical protein
VSSDPADLQAVLDAELAHLHHHRHPDQHDPAIVRRSLIGLALSGGGIRSATTNLGILQALASMRILPMVDYLSTVSGGGYVGAGERLISVHGVFLDSGLQEAGKHPERPRARGASPGADSRGVKDETGNVGSPMDKSHSGEGGHGASKKLPPNA